MNFTYLKPKTTEEISKSFLTASDKEIFNLWDCLPNSFSREATAYEELKRRSNSSKKAKQYVDFIESNDRWFYEYKLMKDVENEMLKAVENEILKDSNELYTS